MNDLVKFTLLGLGLGAIYGLLAQGLVVVYRGSGVLNFAHGAMAALGAYAYVEGLETGLPRLLAMVFGVAVAALSGVLTYVLVMRPLRHASALVRLVATLAILAILQQVLVLRYGDRQRFVASILPSGVWSPYEGIVVGIDRIYLLGIGILVTTALWALYRYTKFGLTTSAVAENTRATAALGRSPDVVAAVNWAAGAGLAGLAAILVLPITGLSIGRLVLLVIPALATALVGGFSSFPLTMAGGLLIGVIESNMTRYVQTPGWPKAAPFLVIVAVLVIRGKALPVRGHVLERLPLVGTGRIRLPVVAVAIGAALIFIFGASVITVDAVTFTCGSAIVFLSLVVVTGYTGQLSLAQFALAGTGAFIAARLADAANLPFLLALLVGVVATVPVGLIVAVPALRTRGANLAIATLGVAVVIEEVVLSNAEYTGGFEGTTVGTPSFFGMSLDPIGHPERYAALCFLVFVLAALAVANLRRGRSGRRLLAVRTNERAAASLGISVVGTKLYAFGLGAAIAALGGILLAFRHQRVLFDQYNVMNSINAVVLTSLGGVGFLLAPLLGAAALPGGLIDFMIHRLTDWQRYLLIVSGIGVLVTLIRRPHGILLDVAERAGGLLNRLSGRRRRDEPLANAEERVAVPARCLGISEVGVRFGGVVALDGVSFSVAPGEVVGLIGPNGAGKTTLIDVVTGFTRPTVGTVTLDDQPIGRWSARRRAAAGVGRSFQSLELFDDLSVQDNIRAAADRRDGWAFLADLFGPRNEPLSGAAVAAIHEFGLADDLERRPSELSYGKRRLVAIARAVAAAPSVLLLDEPAAGLDDLERQELGHLIRRLAREWNLAVLLVEHDVPMVMAVCDRIVALDFGRKIAEGTPLDISQDPEVARAYFGEETASSRRDNEGTVSPSDAVEPQVAR